MAAVESAAGTSSGAPESPGTPAVPPPRAPGRRRTLSLRTRILLTLGSLVGAILLLSGALNIVTAHRERLEALRLRAELVANAQSAALADPIWEYDQDAGHAALNGLLDDPEFVEAIVIDDTGQTFAHVVQPAVPRSGGALVVVQRRVQILSPAGGVRPLGSVELRFSQHLVARKLRAALLLALLQLLVLVAVVSVGIVLGLRRFTRPIEEMTRIIRRRAQGDLSLDVDRAYLERDDEVGAIAQSLELDQQQRRDEAKLLEITSDVSAETHIETFLRRLAAAGRELLAADQCTVYVHDRQRDLLWSVGDDDETPRTEVRPGQGLLGAAFATGQVLKLDNAAADPRFDPAVDRGAPAAPADPAPTTDPAAPREENARALSLLCVPMINKNGTRVGVIQVLDHRGGAFTERDELRLRSLAAQAAVAVDNARLLEEVLDEKTYSESILASLSDGVVSVDAGLRVARANPAAYRIFGWRAAEVQGRPLRELLPDPENDFEIDIVEKVARSGKPDSAEDADLCLADGRLISVNLTAAPLATAKGEAIGTLVVVDDITTDKRVRSVMTRYLPKKVVDELLQHDRAALGGAAQTVTVLFTDIRGFTTLTEELGPRETVTMLNEYFTEMIDVLDRHNGVLDKFIGDALMGIFGMPFAGPYDADSAVATANEMVAALRPFNQLRRVRGQKEIRIGAGLNTGEAVAGNIGSPKRMSYTVIGDSVNLASRLEGATKVYGTSVLMSEYTFEALRERTFVREVDIIRVKGKTRPVAVYESYAHRPDREEDPLRRAMDCSAVGVRAFRARRWGDARKAFESARGHLPGDPLTAVYLERIARYERTPPPDDWDGVWEMTSK
ncbi:MAG TPA: adenylate/guanylate cyclase domain-containing protein [Polyangia bacterium]|nr:adenylate/guanylate cyclase domain-containing protein [Polyangia bacterium]